MGERSELRRWLELSGGWECKRRQHRGKALGDVKVRTGNMEERVKRANVCLVSAPERDERKKRGVGGAMLERDGHTLSGV